MNDFAEDRCSSAIVPFAQQDMVHTVINGIAPDLEADLGELLRATLEKFVSELTEKKLLKESDAPEINKVKATLVESGLNAFENMKQETAFDPRTDDDRFDAERGTRSDCGNVGQHHLLQRENFLFDGNGRRTDRCAPDHEKRRSCLGQAEELLQSRYQSPALIGQKISPEISGFGVK